jgi:hypothetical protein
MARQQRFAAPTTAAALLLLVAAGACSSTPEPPPLNVAQLPAIRLAVQSVEVENRAQQPANMNFIARRRSEQLAADAQIYLRERVQAAGGSEFARATVEEASLIERARATSGGTFSTEPSWEMVGVLAIKVAVVDGLGIENAFATSRVQIARALSPRTSVESKDNFARQLTNDLLAATSRELDKSVQQNLSSYHAAP